MSESFDDRRSDTTRYIRQQISEVAPILDSDDDDDDPLRNILLKPAFWTSILAGGIAGIAVDFTLYPLDTMKTRLQSEVGFRASGGFKKMYKGVIPVLLCSAPVSAVFFCVYNSVINLLRSHTTVYNPFVYVVAASAGEVLCSTIRVPLEILKQRKQTSDHNSLLILRKAIQKEGVLGLYRGFSSTIAREVPFACIQFPLWEYLLQELVIYQNGEPLTALQTAYCGAIAGATAGAITTPVDVLKTRVMLAEKEKIEKYRPKIYQNLMKEVYRERGVRGFFSGIIPRTLWIMLGGFIYFGTYEQVKLIKELKWCFLKRKIEKLRESASCCINDKVWKLLEFFYCTEQPEQKPVIATDEDIDAMSRGQGKRDISSLINDSTKENSIAPSQLTDDIAKGVISSSETSDTVAATTQKTDDTAPLMDKADEVSAPYQTSDNSTLEGSYYIPRSGPEDDASSK